MNLRKHFLEALTLVIAASLCAVVANALASRDRKITLFGNYPNALSTSPQGGRSRQASNADATRFDTDANAVAGGAVVAPRPTLSTSSSNSTIPAATTAEQKVAGSAAPPKQPAVAPAAPTRQPQPLVSSSESENPLVRFPLHEKQPYVEISGDDVSWLHEHRVLFLDARRTSVYQQGHIAGARPFSVWESDVDEKVNQLYNERGTDPKVAAQPIVIYCSGGDCEDSHMLAQKLWGIQFNNLYVYKDGFPDWERRGGKIHKGDAP